MRFWFFLLIIITTKQDLFYSVFEIVFCFFKFFSTQSTSKNGTEIEAKTFFWVAPSPLWSENSLSIHRRSRGKASWMHRVCLGLESQTKIWKVRNVVPRLTWSGKSRRLCLVRKIVPRSIREQNLHSKIFCRDVLIYYLTSWACSWCSRADSYATFRVDGATFVGRFDFSLIS